MIEYDAKCGICGKPVPISYDRDGEPIAIRSTCYKCEQEYLIPDLHYDGFRQYDFPKVEPGPKMCNRCLKVEAMQNACWCETCRDNYHRQIILEMLEHPKLLREMTNEERGTRDRMVYWPVWQREFKDKSAF